MIESTGTNKNAVYFLFFFKENSSKYDINLVSTELVELGSNFQRIEAHQPSRTCLYLRAFKLTVPKELK
jgi:hypothetical protein